MKARCENCPGDGGWLFLGKAFEMVSARRRGHARSDMRASFERLGSGQLGGFRDIACVRPRARQTSTEHALTKGCLQISGTFHKSMRVRVDRRRHAGSATDQPPHPVHAMNTTSMPVRTRTCCSILPIGSFQESRACLR